MKYFSIEKAKLSEQCENEKNNYLKPDEFDDPPDYSKICSTELIQKKLADFEEKILTQQQMYIKYY